MNSRRPSAVEAMNRRASVALAPLLMSLALHGCTRAEDSGAVELSWNLIDADGGPTKCGDHDLTHMRLWWDVSTVDGVVEGCAEFKCDPSHGVTEFKVPKGSALLRVEPRCRQGDALPIDGYIAPAPIQRMIIGGDVVELHAVVIQIVRGALCPTVPVEAPCP
jgi:hypothetical protein